MGDARNKGESFPVFQRFTEKDIKKRMEGYYATLEGASIARTGINKEGFPFFDAVRPDGTLLHVEVSTDEEGNGPGFLFGLSFPEVKEPKW